MLDGPRKQELSSRFPETIACLTVGPRSQECHPEESHGRWLGAIATLCAGGIATSSGNEDFVLALNSDNSIAWQSGWGNNETLLAQQGIVYDPPFFLGFAGGAGGPSNCAFQDSKHNCLGGFPKLSYQKKVPGKYRQVPDISWLADPLTGVAILISIPGQGCPPGLAGMGRDKCALPDVLRTMGDHQPGSRRASWPGRSLPVFVASRRRLRLPSAGTLCCRPL